jgi:hypothetical protein
MSAWRILLRTIGVLNLVLSVWGFYFWTVAIVSVHRETRADPQAPYFRTAFWTLSTIDAALLLGFIFAAVMLVRLHPRAALIHTCLILTSIACALGPGLLWLLPNGVGTSIAAASGIGGVGLGPLLLCPVPLLYPLISILCVNLAWWKLKRADSDAARDVCHA